MIVKCQRPWLTKCALCALAALPLDCSVSRIYFATSSIFEWHTHRHRIVCGSILSSSALPFHRLRTMYHCPSPTNRTTDYWNQHSGIIDSCRFRFSCTFHSWLFFTLFLLFLQFRTKNILHIENGKLFSINMFTRRAHAVTHHRLRSTLFIYFPFLSIGGKEWRKKNVEQSWYTDAINSIEDRIAEAATKNRKQQFDICRAQCVFIFWP